MMHDTGSSKKVAVLTGLTMLLGGAEISSADTIVQNQLLPPLNGSNPSNSLSYAFFIPSQGTLTAVEYQLTSFVSEFPGVFWDLSLNINSGAFSFPGSGSGAQPINVTQSSSDGGIIAAFTGVGSFPAFFTYLPDCGEGGVGCGEGWTGNLSITYTYTPSTPSEVPLPAALPLFATGLAGLGFMGWVRRLKQKAKKQA